MATTALISTLAAAEEGLHALPASPETFGLLALGFFATLFGITWAFRNVARKR